MITANVPAIFPIFPPVSELLRVRLPDLSILEVYELTKDAAKAERVIIAYRWPYGPRCPEQGCGSLHIRQCRGYKRANELPIRFVCIACGRRFTVRTGYFLSGSSLPFTVWLWALYLVLSTTGCDTITPAALVRQIPISVSQASARAMIRRIQDHI